MPTQTSQAVVNSELIADGVVLNAIHAISNGSSSSCSSQFEGKENNDGHDRGLRASSDVSPDIQQASPEPELSYDKLTSMETEEEHMSRRYQRLRSRQSWLISLLISLMVAFLATFIGMIILATSEFPRKSEELFAPLPSSMHNLHPLSFPEVSTSTPGIAATLADQSLSQLFYGVTYDGCREGTSFDKREDKLDANTMQSDLALDVALLSRVTRRIRLTHNEVFLMNRVIQAINDIKLDVNLTLSIEAKQWGKARTDIFGILDSYENSRVEAIEIRLAEGNNYKLLYEIQRDISRHLTSNDLGYIQLYFNRLSHLNPLKLASDPRLAIEWINTNELDRYYTNLENFNYSAMDPSYLTNWMCNIAPSLDSNVAWFWKNAFNDEAKGISNGIFSQDRTLQSKELYICTPKSH